MNISRMLNTCITYNTHNCNTSNLETKLKYLITWHLINIINKLLEIWK